jgi:agmatinase
LNPEEVERRFRQAIARANAGSPVPSRAYEPAVPTFMEVPTLTEGVKLAPGDLVFVGVPFEGVTVKDPRTLAPQGLGVTPGTPGYARSGATLAPDAIRQASVFCSIDHSRGHLPGIPAPLLDRASFYDAGNVLVQHLAPDAAHEQALLKLLPMARQQCLLLVAGGDHLVPWFSVEAIAQASGRSVGVIVFDSHLDLHWLPRWAGSQWAALMASGALEPKNLTVIGLRGTRDSMVEFEAARALNVPFHTIDDVQREGIAAIAGRAIDSALEGCDQLYVSLDIDGIDPVFLPGQKYPEPGGLSSREILAALSLVASRPELRGFDVCCFSPAYDVTQTGAQLIARCFLEVAARSASRSENA